MTTALDLLLLALLLSLIVGLGRVWRGPGFADRMLAAQLLGTTGVAMLIVLAERFAQPALRDVALVLALLALLAVLAFVARVWDPDDAVEPTASADGAGSTGLVGEPGAAASGSDGPSSGDHRPRQSNGVGDDHG